MKLLRAELENIRIRQKEIYSLAVQVKLEIKRFFIVSLPSVLL